MMTETSKRIFDRAVCGPNSEDMYKACLRRSFHISADLAHAINPNYSEKHQDVHPIYMHKGVVLKVNANQSYASDAVSGSIFKHLCNSCNVPVQEFIVRCDSLCGTTIGPLVATNTGIKTVDIGIGQHAMHSIRETCATTDLLYYYQLMKNFFTEYPKMDKKILGL